MNERIKELAKQSGLIQYDTDSKMVEVEKFAEFLVKECISILEYTHHSTIDRFQAARWIKEHFGVEE